MDEQRFDGSDVLERVAVAGLSDAFMDAVDEDDIATAVDLLRRAGLPEATVRWVVEKMAVADGEH